MALPFDPGRTKGILAGKTVLVLIILAALGIRTILLVSLRPWDDDIVERRVLVDDARSYHYLATRIIETGTFEKFDSGFYLRTPGYPLFLAGIYRTFGHYVWLVLLMQIIIDSLTVLVVYGIARELEFKRRTILIASALYAAALIPAICLVKFYSETLFTFLFALSRIRIRTRAVGTTAFFFAFFVVILPWQARNNHIFGRYALSNLAGTNLCRCNVALTKTYAEGISLADARAELEGTALAGVTDPFERSDIYCGIALDYIRNNAGVFAEYHAKGCVQTFVTTARGGIFDIMALLGLYLMIRGKERIFALLFILAIAYFTFIPGVFSLCRFRIPVIPIYMIAAACGISFSYDSIRNRVR